MIVKVFGTGPLNFLFVTLYGVGHVANILYIWNCVCLLWFNLIFCWLWFKSLILYIENEITTKFGTESIIDDFRDLK